MYDHTRPTMNCKGCMSNIKIRKLTNKECLIIRCAPKRKCPCQRCLVKCSCSVQCEDFINLLKSIFKFKTIGYDYKCIQANSYGFSTLNPTYRRIYPEV